MTDPTLVQLEIFQNISEAHLIKDFLQAHGIEGFIFDEFTHNMGLGPQSYYVRFMVSSEDFNTARKLLAQKDKGDE